MQEAVIYGPERVLSKLVSSHVHNDLYSADVKPGCKLNYLNQAPQNCCLEEVLGVENPVILVSLENIYIALHIHAKSACFGKCLRSFRPIYFSSNRLGSFPFFNGGVTSLNIHEAPNRCAHACRPSLWVFCIHYADDRKHASAGSSVSIVRSWSL